MNTGPPTVVLEPTSDTVLLIQGNPWIGLYTDLHIGSVILEAKPLSRTVDGDNGPRRQRPGLS
jgi:hypothetical protein